MHGWRAVMLAGAVLAVALAFPGVAAADPSCPPSASLGNVHIGDSTTGSLTCDDPSGTGLNYFVTTDGSRGTGTTMKGSPGRARPSRRAYSRRQLNRAWPIMRPYPSRCGRMTRWAR